MKSYLGSFISEKGYVYQLKVKCNSFVEAFFLLNSKDIQNNKRKTLYPLTYIVSEEGEKVFVNINNSKIEEFLEKVEVVKK